MDVPAGKCWRCEQILPSEKNTTCAGCKIAAYCCTKCHEEDRYRHQPECEVWGPKKCGNVGCDVTKNLKECSGCNDAWFCSTKCQQKNWTQHKLKCRRYADDIRNGAKILKTKFDIYAGSSRPLDMPYYFGNSLPVDLLNLKSNEWTPNSDRPEPLDAHSVLSIGCGNIRNLIHTIVNLPEAFLGKLFVTLNDIDPFVLARNILFLYLMLTQSTLNNLGATLTSIWYSLHLTECQYKLLIESLQNLIKFNSKDLENATHGIIFVDDTDLSVLKEIWRKWLHIKCKKSEPGFVNLKEQRDKMFAEDSMSAEGIVVYKQQIPKKYHKSVDDWLQNGVFVPSHFDRSSLIYDNPTLTGRKIGSSPWHLGEAMNGKKKTPTDFDFVYCIPSDLWPFGAWDVLKAKECVTSINLIDLFHQYIASQIQLSMQYLLSGRLEICIINCDCLKLVERFQANHTKVSKSYKSYDRIFTSNVADYVGTATLLHAIKPLLNVNNKHATIVTQYWNWYGLFLDSLVDSETAVQDGTNAKCFEAARKDTKQKFTMANGPRFWLQEYFNNTSCFLKYLRADLMACTISLDESVRQVPSLQDVKNTDGLQMRDFRRELNRVAPFRYRRNIRPENMLRGMSRMVEWFMP